MSVLAHRASALALPGGVWPSLLVLALVITAPLSVFLVGYTIVNVLPRESQFLPQYRVPWFSESVVKYQMDYALGSNEYNDVLFLGASATQAGVVPSSFERTTGLRAYNFGTNIAVGPDGHLEILRAYLKSHPKPRLLVYTAFPRDLGDARGQDVHFRDRFAQAYGPVIAAREPRPHRGPSFYFQEGFWFLYVSVKSGFQHPYEAPRGNRPSHRELGPLLARERGYQEYPQGHVLDLGYLEEMEAFQISSWYQDSFAEMAELAREQDIALMVWIMPIPDVDRSIDNGPLTAWAERFQSKYPEVVVEGLPVEEYARKLWGNPFHLNGEGARLFTQEVSRRVSQFPGLNGAHPP